MHHADQIERWRDQTVTPYDRMRTELFHTPRWRMVKRRHLERKLAAIEFVVSNTV